MRKLMTFMSVIVMLAISTAGSTFAHARSAEIRNDPPDDTYYYENSEVLFGTGADKEGNIIGEAYEFQLPNNGPAKITVAVYNEEPFLTEKVYVEIFNNENEKVDQFSLSLDPEWNWFKFEIEIDKAGTYYVDIYNEIDVFISSGFVDVIE